MLGAGFILRSCATLGSALAGVQSQQMLAADTVHDSQDNASLASTLPLLGFNCMVYWKCKNTSFV